MRTGDRRRWVTVTLGAWLVASPCAAMSWADFVASFGTPATPAPVIEYLKASPLVQAAPKPLFSDIRSETVDGSLAQSYHVAGFDSGFGHLAGVREERSRGTAMSGAQTVSMVTALGGLVLVSLDNQTTKAVVFLRAIELDGNLFPPAEGGTLSMKYERVQISETTVVEEIRDCTLAWIAPLDDAPKLTSHCTGSTKVSKPRPDGTIQISGAPDTLNTTLVYRRELGWVFDQRTRVLEFKIAGQ
jgi:hypothetical protein